MSGRIAIALVAAAIHASAPVMAAPCEYGLDVEEGKAVPCDGLLLPSDTARELFKDAKALQGCRETRATEIAKLSKVIKIKDNRIEHLEKLAADPVIVTVDEGVPWWGVALVGLVGVGVGIGLSSL